MNTRPFLGKIQLLLSGPTARPSKRRSWLDGLLVLQGDRPSKRRSWLDGLLVLQGDRPTSKMDASIPEPTPWPTSPPGKIPLFNDRPFLEEIHCGQNLFFGKSAFKFTIKLAAGRPEREPAKYHPGTPFIQCPPY